MRIPPAAAAEIGAHYAAARVNEQASLKLADALGSVVTAHDTAKHGDYDGALVDALAAVELTRSAATAPEQLSARARQAATQALTALDALATSLARRQPASSFDPLVDAAFVQLHAGLELAAAEASSQRTHGDDLSNQYL